MKSLKDLAAKFKWDFQPDGSRNDNSGLVQLANGFLRQLGDIEDFIAANVHPGDGPQAPSPRVTKRGAR